MSINCTSPKNAGEISICACKSSADDYKRLVNAYDTQKINYTADSASYQRWISEHNDWKNKQGNYIRFKDIDFQEEIDSGMCWGKPRGNGDYQCRESARNKGLPYHEGWVDIGKESCCESFLFACIKDRFRCQRSQGSINNANIEWRNSEPQADPQSNKIWLNVTPPIDNAVPPVYIGVCCAQIFDQITNSGGNIDIDNISQKCGISTSPGTNNTTDKTDKTKTTGATDTNKLSNLKKNISNIFNKNKIFIIVGFISCHSEISCQSTFR